jgi:hypothetical protein
MARAEFWFERVNGAIPAVVVAWPEAGLPPVLVRLPQGEG